MRGEQIQQERRRRTSNLSGRRNRMGIDESNLDRENFAYRFVNDEGTRIHDLTVNDDWEVVQDRDGTTKIDGANVGSEVAIQAGASKTSANVKAVLLRKRKDWYEDDKRSEQRHIDDIEASLKSGAVPGAGNGDNTYIPKAGIVFENGAKS